MKANAIAGPSASTIVSATMGGSSDGEPRATIEVGGLIHDRPRIEDH